MFTAMCVVVLFAVEEAIEGVEAAMSRRIVQIARA